MNPRMVRRRTEIPLGIFPDTLHPVLARIYAARDVKSASELDYALSGLHSFDALSGVRDAVHLLYQALDGQQRILIVGDFDADGATSCAVAVRGLRLLGAQHVDYVVPNRFEYGYGLTPEIVAVAAERSPDIIVTVDNGISSMEGVQAAKRRGIRVLVTDHHLPGRTLPEADAIVNPNQPGDGFPSKCLAGVGVMFYVLMALRAHLREADWFKRMGRNEPNLAQLLDLVALGTVADLVSLDRNNRILVAHGVKRIRSRRCQPGIRALLEIAGRSVERVVASDLAFAVAPRLNAAGRLTDMGLGIDCLLAEDEGAAAEMAETLDHLNRERREIEAKMHSQAVFRLEEMQVETEGGLPFGLCLFDSHWHPGVVGIVASRIREQLHRPVIAFALNGDNEVKGSARSIPGLHIRDVLEAISTEHPGVIGKFGGHAMAAGLSVARANFQRFQTIFDAQVRRCLSAEALQGILLSDGELAPKDFELEFAELLRDAGPWGQGFPEPLFDGEFEILNSRIVGERHLKLSLSLPGIRKPIDAIAFNGAATQVHEGGQRAKVAYRLDVNVYRGQKKPQLVIEHLEF